MNPGIHDISQAEYHADPCEAPSLSNSILTTLLQKTPRHAWLKHPRLNPAFEPEPGAQVFDMGSAAHSLLLEGIDAVEVIDAEDWRTNKAKEARDAARAAGKIPLLPHHAAALTEMMTACRDYIASSSLAGIFERGKGERSVLWKDSGVWCRARPDWLADDYSVILDYKTTGVDGPGEFIRRNIVAHGYDTQAVFYPRGLGALGHRGARFIFLVQETCEPYMCYLVEPAESMREMAQSKVARGLQLWKDCLQRNVWPGYSTDVHQAEAPIWAMKDEEAYA